MLSSGLTTGNGVLYNIAQKFQLLWPFFLFDLSISIDIINKITSQLKLNHFLKLLNISKFLDFVKAYGDKFLSRPLLPTLADVAE